MGNKIQAWFKSTFAKKEAKMLMLGLDNAGKTTILYRLKLNTTMQTVPTIGLNVERIVTGKLEFVIWDCGGQEHIRKLWKHYFIGTHAIIFVVDSADQARIEEARKELFKIMNDENLQNVILLVFANKQDLAHAMKLKDLEVALKLNELKQQVIHVQPCCATKGDGIQQGLDWLSKQLL